MMDMGEDDEAEVGEIEATEEVTVSTTENTAEAD